MRILIDTFSTFLVLGLIIYFTNSYISFFVVTVTTFLIFCYLELLKINRQLEARWKQENIHHQKVPSNADLQKGGRVVKPPLFDTPPTTKASGKGLVNETKRFRKG